MRSGSQQLARISGLGAMKPNTVILGFGRNQEIQNEVRDEVDDGENLQELFEHCERNHEDVDKTQRNIELLKTVLDMLKLEKNVCLARNFENLTKENRKFIDVWLIDFFDKPNYQVSDPGNSFMMQLGTILTMTKEWKKFKLRIFVRIINPEDELELKRHLERTLKELRIDAQVIVINFKRTFSLAENSGAVLENSEKLTLMKISDDYMKEINETIKSHSNETSVTFLKLPQPPKGTDEEIFRMYQMLKIQSEDLTVMYVHGIKTVVSSSL